MVDPTKAVHSTVTAFAEKYKGREDELEAKLVAKYSRPFVRVLGQQEEMSVLQTAAAAGEEALVLGVVADSSVSLMLLLHQSLSLPFSKETT